MSEINDGGPAFPTITTEGPADAPVGTYVTTGDAPGMSLRDWFAGQALVGLLSHTEGTADPAASAEWAFKVADAMIAACTNHPAHGRATEQHGG